MFKGIKEIKWEEHKKESKIISFLKKYLRKAFHPIKKFFRNIFVICAYAKFLWNDHYDWDYSYVLALLEFKLQRMYKFFSSAKNVSMVEEQRLQILSEIDETLKAFKVIGESDYAKDEWATHYAKWGEIEFVEVPDKPGIYEMTHKNIKTQEEKEQEIKEVRKVLDVWYLAEERAYHTIFALLAKNLRNWWD